VATRVSSSQFVGRRAELTRLEASWKAAVVDERAATVLLSGEAGVGKSRLVAELVARIPEPSLVLIGQCFDLVDRAMPFGPIVQVMRTLHRTLDDATLEAVIGPGRDELAVLLPEIHTPAREGIVAGALFEQLLGAFERLTERVPTLLVLEDLHWADRSTRELFVYLARSLRTASMVLVGTYRSDDLHRRHPLRGVLAELDRSGAVERIELARFDRDEVRELISAIVGSEPSVELVDRTYRRSDGNAFFAEELLAVDDEYRASMPPTLREIVLARVDGLSEPAQYVLRCAAVIGRSADHRLLEAAAGIPREDLLAGLREAVAHQILVTDVDGLEYRFRHALVREAVEDDLLPGDRVALHTRVAEVLAEHPIWFDGGAAQLGIESAIVDCSGDRPVLLRPGVLTRERIESAAGVPLLQPDDGSPPAPGTLPSHYAPRAALRLMTTPMLRTALEMLGAEPLKLAVYSRSVPSGVATGVRHRRMPARPEQAAHELFSVLRELDREGVHLIWVEEPPPGPEWEGVRDRLVRAAAS